MKHQRTCLIFLSAIMCAGSSAAYSAPVITATEQGEKSLRTTFTPNDQGIYEADDIISTDARIDIGLDQTPVKIEWREVYQGAVGDEGPWYNVPGAQQTTNWAEIEAHKDFSFEQYQQRQAQQKPAITWPENFDCEGAGIENDPETCTRWKNIYARCPPVKEDGTCYTYRSEIQLRIQYDGSSPFEMLVIKFPGGC
ncbi:MAG: hypothetical protein KDI13_04350 [Alphaproteobacteria bacterium]|nr:hypothetical protein [Alphaproteobacteria bacterium]